MNLCSGSAVGFHCDRGKRCYLAIFISAFRTVGETILYLFSPVHFRIISYDHSWSLEHNLSCQPTPWPWMRFAWNLTGCDISGILETEFACPVVLKQLQLGTIRGHAGHDSLKEKELGLKYLFLLKGHL